MLQIQAAIVGAVSYLAEPHRRLVCEEDLIDMSKQRRTYSASCPAPGRAWMRCAGPGVDAIGCDACRYPTRRCFLFSDRLVVVKPKGARLKFKWEIDLVNANGNVSLCPFPPLGASIQTRARRRQAERACMQARCVCAPHARVPPRMQ